MSLPFRLHLDPELSSPYTMYQYLPNTDDQSVTTYLKYFMFLFHDEIKNLAAKSMTAPMKDRPKRHWLKALSKWCMDNQDSP